MADREELFTPDELAVRLDEWANCLDKSQWDSRSDLRCAAIHLRRLASSDGGGVKGGPEPVAWPANLNSRTLDLVQRFALALAKKLRLAEEKYGHTNGWMRDDWESECRDHLYQHLEKGDPRDVAAYCAFMWHHGWITYRPEPVASKRPVAFRVRQHRLSNHYELYTDEKDAQFWADDRGVDYEGLYLVADRYLAPPADAGMREALEEIEALCCHLRQGGPDLMDLQELSDALEEATNLASKALTAPGATTKSDGGVESRPATASGSGPLPVAHTETEEACSAIEPSNGVTSDGRQQEQKRAAGVAPGPSDPSSSRSDVTALASLQGEDAVERVARLVEPRPFEDDYPLGSMSAFNAQGRKERAYELARRILATGLVPDEAAIRADASYLDFFEKNTDMELSCSWEDDDGPWEVHSVTGGRNDREWTKVGQGATPREAIAAAIRYGDGQ